MFFLKILIMNWNQIQYRVIIAGTRSFNDYNLLKENCEYLLRESMEKHQIIIVSGQAKGADTMGERFAKEHGLPCEYYPANWQIHGRAAGPIRNKEMANNADALIAFWDGHSRGTRSMINLARKMGLQVAICRYDKLKQTRMQDNNS